MKWEKPQAENYTIDVVWNPQARIYTLTLKSPHMQAPVVQWGASLASAMRELANRLEEQGKFGSDEELISDPAFFTKDADCKYCSAPIMFAKIPPQGKWLAFDVVAVQAEQCRGTRVARFQSSSFSRNGRMRSSGYIAKWLAPTATGPAWIPHPETCGKSKMPISPGAKTRWQEHHNLQYSSEVRKEIKNAPEETSDVIAGLRAIAAEAKKVKDDLSR